jgi:probable rRNA maturation factor
VISVEVENRSGIDFDDAEAVLFARRLLADEGIEEGDLGLQLVSREEIRQLKKEHLGIDEEGDVLSFPIDAREPVPDGVPRQLGDVVLCPQVVGHDWQHALAHGLLHLLGYEHGDAMECREAELTG